MEASKDISTEVDKAAEKLSSDLKISVKNNGESKAYKKYASSKKQQHRSDAALPKSKPPRAAKNSSVAQKGHANITGTNYFTNDELIRGRMNKDNKGNKQKYQKRKDKDIEKSERSIRKPVKHIERCYGMFRCRECGIYWESAYTWRIAGTFRVIYRQQCNTCREYIFPHKTQHLECRKCKKPVPDCVCSDSRDDDDEEPDKPHRADLCEKCQSSIPCRPRKTR